MVNTRNLSLIATQKLGYNCCYCDWDAWAGHWKPWCVGKPRLITTEQISESFKEAVLTERSAYKRTSQVDNTAVLGRMGRAPSFDWEGMPTLPTPRIDLPSTFRHGLQAVDAQHVATVSPPVFDFDGRSEE